MACGKPAVPRLAVGLQPALLPAAAPPRRAARRSTKILATNMLATNINGRDAGGTMVGDARCVRSAASPGRVPAGRYATMNS
jgi:hypothetical protein